MSLYDNEENAVVNNPGGVSETPSNLVNNNLDLITSKEELDKILQYKQDGNVDESKLSPNPAGFGFTSQEFVDSLPNIADAKPNVLYILKVKNDGVVVGYRLYKYIPFKDEVAAHYEKFGATPDLKLEKGEQKQEAVVVNEPKEETLAIHKKVVLDKEPDIQGKPLHKWIDENGDGVTQEELEAYVKANPTLAGTEGDLEGIEVGGTKYKNVPKVTANPALAGSESDLTSIQIGVTKFNVGKPIYYHPISLFGSDYGALSFLILDNSPTPYTKETLLAKIANFDRISPLSGIIRHDAKWLVAAYGWKSGNTHYILGACTDGTPITGSTNNNSLEDFINLSTTSVSDGVNKIN